VGSYRIVYRRSVEKELRSIPPPQLKEVIEKIHALAADRHPRGSVKLKGGVRDLYRARHGDYRIIYEVHDDEIVVLVVKVGHRRDVYSQL
jgi:mRNA interferase RelE/StbE